MNRWDVIFNERLNVHTVFLLDDNGTLWNTGHAYRDEDKAWAYLFRCEAMDRKNSR